MIVVAAEHACHGGFLLADIAKRGEAGSRDGWVAAPVL